ncbi:MAG: MoaD/ThiS family protein [Desulfobacula sp.]|jgi:molybdopterin converting factor small subunit
MDITLRLTKFLARLNNGQKESVISLLDNSSVAQFINHLDRTMPGLKDTILNPDGDIADSINIYINGDNIRSGAGTATLLSDGNTVAIIPAAAAG